MVMNTYGEQKILLVDDELEIVELLRDFLEAEGYQIFIAHSGEEAMSILKRYHIDCVLLDIMMPGLSGFEVCRQIRKDSQVSILILSARQDDTDKIRGLGLGADDYIVKSASPGEIVARIKAVLRRSQPNLTNFREGQAVILHSNNRESELVLKGLRIDLLAYEVWVNEKLVVLTNKEFELLRLLVEHPRQVFSREQLFNQVWGDYGDLHTVTVHIARLREKLERDQPNYQYIHTVWGVGYKFEVKEKGCKLMEDSL